MARRLTYGPLLIIALIALLWLDDRLGSVPVIGMGLIVLVLGTLACARAGYELTRIFGALGVPLHKAVLPLATPAGFLIGAFTIGRALDVHRLRIDDDSASVLAGGALLTTLLAMLAALRHKSPKGAALATAAAIFAFVYLGISLAFLFAVRIEHSVWAMAAVVFIVKACDSGAYFTGSSIGKHKLIPWISPGKTWEGLIGGLITAAAFGAGFVALHHGLAHAPAHLDALTWVDGVVLGVVLGAVGQLGDLSASVLKRDAGIKDAGRILPGFGGLLDMLDSLVIAGPVAYFYLHLRTAV
ncbi:hypothetical protein BH11PLA1_BH11PLA1_03950 [soil metagenome]